MGKGRKNVKIEIMDCTLRDGEQTCGVSFVPHEKLIIARMLLEKLKVDRIEIGSARVSGGEFKAAKMICDWAAERDMLQKVEILGFVDGHASLDWIHSAGCKVINLLCKGSLKHCTCQLKKTPEQHIQDVLKSIQYADQVGIDVNVYLEDWSNGMKDSPEYVYQIMDALLNTGVKRFMLPDTLGILNPLQTIEYIRKMVKRYPHVQFDFHAHNDYDLAVSNVLAAVLSGVKGLHTTINGLGERAGNAPLASVQAILKDHFSAITNIDESKLNEVSRVVESYSGIPISPNQPIVGESVFTQVAGVHADGDNKSNLYCNDLLPERFGRVREYALGKTSGKANIRKNMESLGLKLDETEMKKVTDRITELGDKKEIVTPEDLPYIISDVLKHNAVTEKVKLRSYFVAVAYGLKPTATLSIDIDGKVYEESSSGDGQYDAFVRALRKIYKGTLKRTFPDLENYQVNIPPGGRSDAFVQASISWKFDDNRIIRTRGLDADQTEAAIKATIKMLNLIEQNQS
ncbi:MAG: 2-isopropylmalate synthase [Bacteroidaceae bacterium]|nr:2-isopropylmalate synthase [Bacteroidaceae bacterium]